MTAILQIHELFKNFGGVKAIQNFSLDIEEHEIYGLIGPNGAGKTTIFNTITGIYKPTSGSIKFEGKNLVGLKPSQVASAGIGRTFQNIRLFGNLTALDNVFIASQGSSDYNLLHAFTHLGRFNRVERELRDRSMQLLGFVGLTDVAHSKAGSLPYGYQRRLEIARSLALNPKLILLDEPAAGMNSDESHELVNFIFQLHNEYKLTILLIEHHMDVVIRLCDQITVLNFGETISRGTPGKVTQDPCVIEAYLGRKEVQPC
jgi:branched-chain amino acid transport system ATP-binding protein